MGKKAASLRGPHRCGLLRDRVHVSGCLDNLGVSDCPVAWDLQRAPLGRFRPSAGALGKLWSRWRGRNMSLCLPSFWHILPPRCPFTATPLGVARCEASAVLCLLQMGGGWGLRFLTKFTWSLKQGQWGGPLWSLKLLVVSKSPQVETGALPQAGRDQSQCRRQNGDSWSCLSSCVLERTLGQDAGTWALARAQRCLPSSS